MSALIEIGCDLLLGISAFGILGGIIVLVWATVTGLDPAQLVSGAALIGLGAVLLLLWERIAWEPVARELSQRLSKLT